MKITPHESRRIKILRDSVAQKIAAGEVIDRPAAVVRELLDNALDAGANEISVSIENGGVTHIRVVDDGSGMDKKDLELCWLPHATSKIEHEDDLLTATSLGFRGEALASIAACSRLEITSKTAAAESGYRITVENGNRKAFTPSQGREGTIVDVKDLFYSLPARRRFLKSSRAETSQCRSVFFEKALPFPEVSFRFISDDDVKFVLSASDKNSQVERVASLYSPGITSHHLFEYSSGEDDYSFTIVGARPEITRKDRKLIQIYANKRRVFDYSFVQAVEYGFSQYITGGNFPVCFVFITLPPDRIDFNIHPAKKEARFKDERMVHHDIGISIKQALSQYNLTASRAATSATSSATPGVREEPRPGQTDFFRKIIERRTDAPAPLPDTVAETTPSIEPKESRSGPGRADTFTYHGQIFNLFLLAECGDTFYIIDQHAAHERIIYETLMTKQNESNTLLFPITFTTTAYEDSILEITSNKLRTAGITVSKKAEKKWQVDALPPRVPKQDIVEIIKQSLVEPDNLEMTLYAAVSCKAAVKDGEPLAPEVARTLIQNVFSLENSRCPHGRPIWYAVTRKELFFFVGRT